MPKMLLTQSNIRFIKANRLKMNGSAMAKRFGVRKSVVNNYMRKNGLTAPHRLVVKWRADAMRGKTTSTPAVDRFLRKNYLTINVNQLSIKIGRSETFIKIRLRQLNLIIPRSIIKQRIKDSRIKKGHVPMNKGRKQKDYMTKEMIERTKATRFKKGHLPFNSIGVKNGDTRIHYNHKERNNKPYKWIRISLGNWRMLHVVNWEKKHGPVPAGHIIVFKNGDTMNCKVSNLQMITQRQHAANTRNKDQFIAMTLSHTKGKGKGNIDREVYQDILKNPELLDLKRHQLTLKRTIHETTRKTA